MIQRLKPWKKLSWASVVLGSLTVGLPAIAQSLPSQNSGINQQAYPTNYCPSVFLEPRFNQNGRLTSLYCPGYNATPTPLPADQQAPSARIAPTNGQVTVRLVNQTGEPVTYQVIGDTNQRSLATDATYSLTQLSTPTTITFQRNSEGALTRIVTRSMGPGMVEVVLYPTTNLGNDRNAMTIQETGEIFLN